MPSFYGEHKNHSYFEGWYLKNQNDTDTIALIPALHINEAGQKSASLQILTPQGAYNIPFEAEEFKACRSRFGVRLGEDCLFNEKGCRLEARSDDCRIRGVLRFGELTSPRYDVMGPLNTLPFLQCRHSVLSLRHSVEGYLNINDEQYQFEGGVGYVEGDRGRSFPKSYLWSQCCWEENSLMMAVADIPLPAGSITGCLALVWFEGKEYRFASYLGGEILYVDGSSVLLRQGKRLLHAELIKSDPKQLRAPQSGDMSRRIWASAACEVRYRLSEGNHTIFEITSVRASFEHDWRPAQK